VILAVRELDMEHKTIDGKRIQSITADGLVYLNDSGDEEFIDFSACYSYYFKRATSPEYIERLKDLNPQTQWDDERVKKYVERRTKWREIALRNIIGDPWGTAPYLEFYTEPCIRFEFATEDEYRETRYLIEQYGWRTHDLS
jgi:hypothetical protein